MKHLSWWTFAAFLAVLALTAPDSALAQQAVDDESVEEPPPPLAIPAGYRYDPAGRRDPFVNPIPLPPVPEPTGPVIPAVRPDGLPGVLLNEAVLLGVVDSPNREMSLVIIQAPGNRRYVARPGDELLDVIISDVRPGSVVFEVKPLEGASEPAQREQVVRPVGAAPGE
jgi:hypothetical protein